MQTGAHWARVIPDDARYIELLVQKLILFRLIKFELVRFDLLHTPAFEVLPSPIVQSGRLTFHLSTHWKVLIS